jgi:hypothetical protein
LTYIALAARNSELIVIKDMETFARYYCYAKKQKQGQIVLDHVHPVTVEGGDEQPVLEIEIEEKQSDEDDDI